MVLWTIEERRLYKDRRSKDRPSATMAAEWIAGTERSFRKHTRESDGNTCRRAVSEKKVFRYHPKAVRPSTARPMERNRPSVHFGDADSFEPMLRTQFECRWTVEP